MWTKQWLDSIEKDRLSETEIGKFILCEAREDNVTRLFIHKFNRMYSVLTKNGWWDTFTISTKACDKGFYLCSIQNFRIDSNGYLNCIVCPNKFLGSTIDEDSIAWDYLFYTGKFSSEYKARKYRQRFNQSNLEKKYSTEFKESGYPKIEYFIMAEFMNDRITLEDMATALEEKYDIEKLADDINKNVEKYRGQYPILIKKLPKDSRWEVYTTDCTVYYLQDKDFEYSKLKLGEETNLLNRVEAVLKYWDDIYKEKREKEKAERKLKRTERKLLEKKGE